MFLGSSSFQRCSRCLIRAKRIELQCRRLRIVRTSKDPHRENDSRARSYGRPQNDSLIRYGPPRPDAERDNAKRAQPASRNARNYMRPRIAIPFEDALPAALKEVESEQKETHFIKSLARQRGDESVAAFFKKAWRSFRITLSGVPSHKPWTTRQNEDARDRIPLDVLRDLRQVYAISGKKDLRQRITYAFHDHLMAGHFSAFNLKMQKELADMRHPVEWYAKARQRQREIHLHVGPTNSGKTYQALKRLEEVKEKGAYAGPLRLLAYEVFTRMNAKGISTVLITGDDRRAPEDLPEGEDPKIAACTVEMMNLAQDMEVCVIDEIQMIADKERGWAWTRAVLGSRASELHLCGEERAVPLIEKMCAATGDKLHIHRYQRLSPLKMSPKSLNANIMNLRKGDCVVCFSVQGIHAMKRMIEEKTGSKVAIIYGSLPPETRAAQAKLFNDPNSGYDYLVASDAVGMGLNLAIKRVVFEATVKHNGMQQVALDHAHIKQIGGRAGRYRIADGSSTSKDDSETQGLVTTLDPADYDIVKQAIEADPPPLRTMGIAPTEQIVEKFASYFPVGTPFTYILTKLNEHCTIGTHYHLDDARDTIYSAQLIEPIRGLTIPQRLTICSAPSWRDDDQTFEKILPALAQHVADHSKGVLTEIREIPLEILDEPESASRVYLRRLESLHKSLVIYLWLSYQFEGCLVSRALAMHVKGLVEVKLERALANMQFTDRSVLVKQRRAREAKQELEAATTADLLSQLSASGEHAPANLEIAAEPSYKAAEEIEAEVAEEAQQLPEYSDSTEPVTPDQTDKHDRFDELGKLELDELETPQESLSQESSTVSEVHAAVEQPQSASSFAAWRSSQTPGESQGSHDPEKDDDFVKRVAEASS